MKELCKYLLKYKDLTPPQASKKKLLVSIIKNECGLVVAEDSITLCRGGAFIKCHPVMRTEIAHCAPRILAILHKEHNTHLSHIR